MKNLLVLIALAATPTPPPEQKPTLEVMAKARGFTIESSAIGGGLVLHAGDHVDVIGVVPDPESKRLTSVTLLQNVIVLSNAAPAPGEARQLTLLLIPEEAEILAFAKEAGHVSATLRNVADPELIDQPGMTTMASVLSGERVPFPKAKKK